MAEIMHLVIRVAALAGLAAAASAALAQQQAAPAERPAPPEMTEPSERPAPMRAVWNEQEIEFTYMGFTSYYSCDGLRDKVRYLLRQLGAREDLKVRSAGCARMSGPEMFPRVRINAAVAVPATPERLEKLAAEASKRELIARVNRRSSTVGEATEQFGASTRVVEFRDRPNGKIQAGDCELMERFRDEVLPKLELRVVESDIRCIPRSVHPGSIRLVVEVLDPVRPDAQVP